MDSTAIEQLQQLIWKHEREMTVFDLVSRKQAIEEHGLPCELELASKDDGYMMIKTIAQAEERTKLEKDGEETNLRTASKRKACDVSSQDLEPQGKRQTF